MITTARILFRTAIATRMDHFRSATASRIGADARLSRSLPRS